MLKIVKSCLYSLAILSLGFGSGCSLVFSESSAVESAGSDAGPLEPDSSLADASTFPDAQGFDAGPSDAGRMLAPCTSAYYRFESGDGLPTLRSNSANLHCYIQLTGPRDGDASLKRCERLTSGNPDFQSHLVSLNELDEYNFVRQHYGDLTFWFGLRSDIAGTNGDYQYSDGTLLEAGFSKWETNSDPPEPNNGSEHCVAQYANRDLWHDDGCGSAVRQFAQVCEVQPR